MEPEPRKPMEKIQHRLQRLCQGHRGPSLERRGSLSGEVRRLETWLLLAWCSRNQPAALSGGQQARAACSPSSSLPLPPSRHQHARQWQPPTIQLCGGPKAWTVWPGLTHPPTSPRPGAGAAPRHPADCRGTLTATSTLHSSPTSSPAGITATTPTQHGPSSAPRNGGPFPRPHRFLPIHTHAS